MTTIRPACSAAPCAPPPPYWPPCYWPPAPASDVERALSLDDKLARQQDRFETVQQRLIERHADLSTPLAQRTISRSEWEQWLTPPRTKPSPPTTWRNYRLARPSRCKAAAPWRYSARASTWTPCAACLPTRLRRASASSARQFPRAGCCTFTLGATSRLALTAPCWSGAIPPSTPPIWRKPSLTPRAALGYTPMS